MHLKRYPWERCSHTEVTSPTPAASSRSFFAATAVVGSAAPIERTAGTAKKKKEWSTSSKPGRIQEVWGAFDYSGIIVLWTCRSLSMVRTRTRQLATGWFYCTHRFHYGRLYVICLRSGNKIVGNIFEGLFNKSLPRCRKSSCVWHIAYSNVF